MPDHLTAVRKAAERLRTRQSAVDDARAELNDRIYAAARAGVSMTKIAAAAGVTRQWISRLLEKR